MSLKKIERAIFFLCLLFLPTQLGKHFWPQFSLVYSLPVDYLSPTLYFWDLLVLGLGFLWVLNKPKINWSAVNLSLIFFLGLLPSLFMASNVGASLTALWRFLIVIIFGIYVASQRLEEIKGLLFYGVSISVFYESLIAGLEFLTGGSLNIWILGERSFNLSTPAIATFNYVGRLFLRPYATFPHPNVLGAFMVISAALIWVIKDNVRKEWKFLNLVLSAVSVVLTFSRAAIFVYFMEILFGLKRKVKYLIIPLILLIPVLWIRYSSVFNFDSLSILRREELAVIAVNDFGSSPIFGIGLNNFINKTASSNLIVGTSRFLQPVHNIFLLLLAETGLVGFLAFCFIIGWAIFKIWKKRETEWARVLLFIWGGIIFLGMFDHYFLTLPQGQRLLFLVWGLSMLG